MTKLLKLLGVMPYIIIVLLLSFILIDNNIMFAKYENYSVCVGLDTSTTILEDIASADESILQSQKAIDEANILIEDAKKRGLFD